MMPLSSCLTLFVSFPYFLHPCYQVFINFISEFQEVTFGLIGLLGTFVSISLIMHFLKIIS